MAGVTAAGGTAVGGTGNLAGEASVGQPSAGGGLALASADQRLVGDDPASVGAGQRLVGAVPASALAARGLVLVVGQEPLDSPTPTIFSWVAPGSLSITASAGCGPGLVAAGVARELGLVAGATLTSIRRSSCPPVVGCPGALRLYSDQQACFPTCASALPECRSRLCPAGCHWWVGAWLRCL